MLSTSPAMAQSFDRCWATTRRRIPPRRPSVKLAAKASDSPEPLPRRGRGRIRPSPQAASARQRRGARAPANDPFDGLVACGRSQAARPRRRLKFRVVGRAGRALRSWRGLGTEDKALQKESRRRPGARRRLPTSRLQPCEHRRAGRGGGKRMLRTATLGRRNKARRLRGGLLKAGDAARGHPQMPTHGSAHVTRSSAHGHGRPLRHVGQRQVRQP